MEIYEYTKSLLIEIKKDINQNSIYCWYESNLISSSVSIFLILMLMYIIHKRNIKLIINISFIVINAIIIVFGSIVSAVSQINFKEILFICCLILSLNYILGQLNDRRNNK
jgi:hypothetical protein